MHRRGNDERGAALVEYALLVALVALVALAAIDLLEGAARQSYDRAEFSVGRGASVTTTTRPPAPSTTTRPVTTTTTRPSATTTTTRPPATTSTTTTAPRRSSAALVDVTTATSGWTRWVGSAVVRLTDTGGAAVAGARVQVRVTAGGTSQTVTVTTDAAGRATVEVGPYDWLFGGVTSAEVEVVGVEGGGVPWDGVGPRTTISVR